MGFLGKLKSKLFGRSGGRAEAPTLPKLKKRGTGVDYDTPQKDWRDELDPAAFRKFGGGGEGWDLRTVDLADWQPLVSSNISAVKYGIDDEKMHVRFHSGAVYEYDDVPIEIYRAFLTTHSPGQLLWYAVRDRFPYRKIADEGATTPAADRFSGRAFAVPDDVQAALKRAGVQEPQGGIWNQGTPKAKGVSPFGSQVPLPFK